MSVTKSITELIKTAISDTAERLNNNGIISVEDMIPHMSTILKEEEYPKKRAADLQYDVSSDAKIDIYYPEEGEGPFSVFLEVHGGAWYFGQKSSIEFKPFLEGLNRGYACVSVGYTLSPKAVYPQAVLEIKRAIAYIKKNAKELNINPGKIALWGGSAGAQLAALAVLSGDTGYLSRESGVTDSSVGVMILWYGCYNFFVGKQLDRWVYENYYGSSDLSQVSESIVLSNPVCHITDKAPDILLQHGLSDVVVPYEQSVCFYNAMKSIVGEGRCRLELLEGCDHADVKMFGDDNIKLVFDYIDSRLSPEKTIKSEQENEQM